MMSATNPSKIQIDTLISELASAMSNSNGKNFLDIKNLEVVTTTVDPIYATDHVPSDEDDGSDFLPSWVDQAIPGNSLADEQPDRFIPVQPVSKSEKLSTIKLFIESIKDPKIRHDLEESLAKPHAIAAFQKELTFHTGFRSKWSEFKDHHYHEIAKKRLKELGVIS